MARPLFKHLDELRPRVAAAPLILLFLDFDGTLSPIVDHPGLAILPSKPRKILAELAQRESFVVIVMSGRALADLHPRVDVAHLIYAGNHGLEISGRGLQFVEPVSITRRPALERLLRNITPELSAIAGVEIEDKGLTASIHFRQAPETQDEVRRIVEAEVGESGLFTMREGKMIYEVLPNVPWHKDAAFDWIRKMPSFEQGLAIGVGDDTTDEDLFSAVADGISVRIGEAATTAAQYFVTDTDDVQSFLVWLGGTTAGRSQFHGN
jgi:trehalose-phosphatase